GRLSPPLGRLHVPDPRGDPDRPSVRNGVPPADRPPARGPTRCRVQRDRAHHRRRVRTLDHDSPDAYRPLTGKTEADHSTSHRGCRDISRRRPPCWATQPGCEGAAGDGRGPRHAAPSAPLPAPDFHTVSTSRGVYFDLRGTFAPFFRASDNPIAI